jgi:hypothetical protein
MVLKPLKLSINRIKFKEKGTLFWGVKIRRIGVRMLMGLSGVPPLRQAAVASWHVSQSVYDSFVTDTLTVTCLFLSRLDDFTRKMGMNCLQKTRLTLHSHCIILLLFLFTYCPIQNQKSEEDIANCLVIPGSDIVLYVFSSLKIVGATISRRAL